MDFRRWVAWIISPWTALLALGWSAMTLRSGGLSPGPRFLLIIVFGLSVLTVFMVGLKLATAGEGVMDWHGGGVAGITRDDAVRIEWSDWAILMTRKGVIDFRRMRLRLETRVFLGLIPWEKIDRPFSPLDDVVAEHHYYETRDDEGHVQEHYDHVVELHRADGQPIRLIDITSDQSRDASARLADRLCASIKAASRRLAASRRAKDEAKT